MCLPLASNLWSNLQIIFGKEKIQLVPMLIGGVTSNALTYCGKRVYLMVSLPNEWENIPKPGTSECSLLPLLCRRVCVVPGAWSVFCCGYFTGIASGSCLRTGSHGFRIRVGSVLVFLISNFRRVLNILCFLLGSSPASELYMPTFRNTLFVPSS